MALSTSLLNVKYYQDQACSGALSSESVAGLSCYVNGSLRGAASLGEFGMSWCHAVVWPWWAIYGQATCIQGTYLSVLTCPKGCDGLHFTTFILKSLKHDIPFIRRHEMEDLGYGSPYEANSFISYKSGFCSHFSHFIMMCSMSAVVTSLPVIKQNHIIKTFNNEN